MGPTQDYVSVSLGTVDATYSNLPRGNNNTEDDSASETSTIAYDHVDHEAFETFQTKVAQLAAEIFPQGSTIAIDRMKGGSSNRVIGLTVSPPRTRKFVPKWIARYFQRRRSSNKQDGSTKYILRIPRFDVNALEWEVAALNVIASRLPLPTPKVVKYDVTKHNALGKPYMLQEQLPGHNLSAVADELNLEQWKCVAKSVTEISSTIAAFTSLSAGEMSLDNLSTAQSSDVHIEKFCVPHRGTTSEDFSKPNTWPAMPQDPLSFMLEQCERWREYQISAGVCWDHVWDGFSEISKSLHERGFLDGPFCLAHGDLLGYNFLVDVKDSATVEVTGVLDWDTAVFAPKFMAYRAPFWLWTDDDVDSYEEDDEDKATVEPEGEKEKALKRVFEAEASEEFKKFAFAPEAMLARRMFAILKGGMFSGQAVQEAEDILSEWEDLSSE
ncbi:hypothetical protein CC80DRAFT_571559 [Byssothecium circinans]|uniref:Aminoglycoside phosphotransferase domain-containing protein n=1 Tax=Byssothecium circinans TaxID=147558 RepID=A0A6A5TJ84_9PLEO|nr:hypothetical protein CC80DRAFT_571559 [Byssothecium circinans]